MRSIKTFILIVIAFFLFIPCVHAKSVSIDSVEVESKSDTTKILEEATIDQLNIKFNVNFIEKDDYIKYKIVLDNATDKDYMIEENNYDNEYIEYVYEYDDNNQIVEKNKKSTMYLTIQYKKEVPIETLKNEGSLVQQNTVSIALDHEDEPNGKDEITENPKTSGKIVYIITILLMIGVIITVLIIQKKPNYLVLLLLLFIPLSIYAIEKLEISFETNITISAKPVCVRATTLKQEICQQSNPYTSSNYYCGSLGLYGQTMTYGNLGTAGELTVGDAFDCDVNNDGVYDADKERFYYVSPEDGNESNSNVTLIYYNSVYNGLPSFQKCNPYGAGMQGPVEGYLHLPSTEQWSNPLLYSNFDRQLKTTANSTAIYYDGDTYPLGRFTYTDRAARLISHAEIAYGCLANASTESIKSECSFLYENTIHSSSSKAREYWMENYASTNIRNVGTVKGDVRRLYNQNATETFVAVRPVIVVSKNNIQYE